MRSHEDVKKAARKVHILLDLLRNEDWVERVSLFGSFKRNPLVARDIDIKVEASPGHFANRARLVEVCEKLGFECTLNEGAYRPAPSKTSLGSINHVHLWIPRTSVPNAIKE